MAGGAATTGASMFGDAVVEEMAADGAELTAEDAAAFADASGAVGATGGARMAFGVFLLISVGVLITGAVFLFKGTKATFIMVAAGVAIAAEVIGILVTAFGVTNLVGLVGGILAILAARQIQNVPVAAAAEEEPAEPAA